MFIPAYTFVCDQNAGSPVDTDIQLFEIAGGNVKDILNAGDKGTWDADRKYYTEQEVFGGPGTYALFVESGVVQPSAPTVWFNVYKFARKAP